MQNKFTSLFIGFVATMIVIVVLVITLGKSYTPAVTQDSGQSQSQTSLSAIGGKTDGLVNYGDLPKVVTKDDIERSNPFDSY